MISNASRVCDPQSLPSLWIPESICVTRQPMCANRTHTYTHTGEANALFSTLKHEQIYYIYLYAYGN